MDLEIIKQALEPSVQENRQLANGSDAEKLQQSMNSPRLASMSEGEIKKLLRIAMIMVGVKAETADMTCEAEKQLLIGFVQTQFGKITGKEFTDAFTMSITGRLNVDPECYQSFSIAFVSRILTAYRKWASTVYQDNYSTMIKPQQSPQLPPQTVDWSDTWEALKSGSTKIIPYPIYNWAVSKGYINLDDNAKRNLCKQASLQLRANILLQTSQSTSSAELREKYRNLNDPEVINEAKRIAVRNALKN